MSLFNTLKEVPQSTTVAHANDTDTFEAYKSALRALLYDFYRAHSRNATVLCLGASGLGQLVQCCVDANAHHVTVCDPRKSVMDLCTASLARLGVDDTKFTVLNKSSLQLPADEMYDVLVHDLFGPLLNTHSPVGYTHDLLRRNVIRSFDAEGAAKRYVIPCEASMSVRIYHAPALSADKRFASAPVETTGPLPKKPKCHLVGNVPCFTLSEANCAAISDRVEVLTEVYDTVDRPVVYPSHIELHPKRFDVPKDECVVVFEWSAALDEAGKFTIGTVIASEAKAEPRIRRARSLAWGHEFIYLTDLTPSLSPLALSVAYKPAGGITLAATPSIPKTLTSKELTSAKLEAMAHATYTKLVVK